MIYLVINEYWAETSNIPTHIAYSSGPVQKIPRALIAASDFIFYFEKDGKTAYIKNRNYDAYQYSDEDKVVLKLKSVLL